MGITAKRFAQAKKRASGVRRLIGKHPRVRILYPTFVFVPRHHLRSDSGAGVAESTLGRQRVTTKARDLAVFAWTNRICAERDLFCDRSASIKSGCC